MVKLPCALVSVAADMSHSAVYGTCILLDGTISTCSCDQMWVAKHRMNEENIRLKCPKSSLNRRVATFMSDPGKLAYDIQLSEKEYKYDNGLQSPTGSERNCKREDSYSEEDSNDEEIGEDGVPQDDLEDTAATLLAMTMSTTTHKLSRPLGNPTHIHTSHWSG